MNKEENKYSQLTFVRVRNQQSPFSKSDSSLRMMIFSTVSLLKNYAQNQKLSSVGRIIQRVMMTIATGKWRKIAKQEKKISKIQRKS